MADALDSKSSGGKPRVGSSPTFGTLIWKDLRQIVVSPFFVSPSTTFNWFPILRLDRLWLIYLIKSSKSNIQNLTYHSKTEIFCSLIDTHSSQGKFGIHRHGPVRTNTFMWKSNYRYCPHVEEYTQSIIISNKSAGMTISALVRFYIMITSGCPESVLVRK